MTSIYRRIISNIIDVARNILNNSCLIVGINVLV